jgi:hypothetical protein
MNVTSAQASHSLWGSTRDLWTVHCAISQKAVIFIQAAVNSHLDNIYSVICGSFGCEVDDIVVLGLDAVYIFRYPPTFLKKTYCLHFQD